MAVGALVFANQQHQLLVAVSKHFYVQKNGLLKYQEKPLEISLATVKKSRKEHLVYYIMRDAYSGTFFIEITTSQTMLPLAEFLYLAWERKQGKYLWGLPASLSVPQGLVAKELVEGLERLGVRLFLPSSGFAAGVRILRDIEDRLFFLMEKIVDQRPHVINERYKEKLYSYLVGYNFGEKYDKFTKWLNALPGQGAREVPDRATFMSNFRELKEPLSGVIWLKTAEQKPRRTPAWEKEPWPPFDRARYDRADRLVGDACDIPERDKCLRRAWEALEISPYCVDAYNLLAEESEILEEKMQFCEKAVRAGRMVLGEEFIREKEGHFWLILETRPYMRALRGYADCLWEAGLREKAIEIYWELLRLNPNDNQGNRYVLSSCLLESGRDEEMRRLMARYGDEKTCFIAYDKALWTFRVTGGVKERSDSMLREALETNRHVPAYLLGEKFIPWRLPDYYGWGSEEEAIIYAAGSRKAWQQTPGASEWLQEFVQGKRDGQQHP